MIDEKDVKDLKNIGELSEFSKNYSINMIHTGILESLREEIEAHYPHLKGKKLDPMKLSIESIEDGVLYTYRDKSDADIAFERLQNGFTHQM